MKQITVEAVLTVLNGILIDRVITPYQANEDLSEYGMDSMLFIQMVVSIEEEFECEIPDSKLLISEMNTVNKVIEVLKSIEG